MKTLIPIQTEYKELLKKKFYEAKRHHRAIMKHLKFSDIGLMWWIKPRNTGEYGVRGWAWNPGKSWTMWMTYKNLNGRKCTMRRGYFIIIDSKKKKDIKGLISTYLHELAHLIAPVKSHHGKKFQQVHAKLSRYK